MDRLIKRSVFAVSLLAIVLLANVLGPALAKSTVTDVEGRADLLGGPPVGEIRPDAAGNLHLRNYTATGSLFLDGGHIRIDGKNTMVLNGNVDSTLTGPLSGTYTVLTDIGGQDTVIWEGRVHGNVVNAIFSGKVVAQGRGPYAGMQLKLDILEDLPSPGDPNPERFTVVGQILNPQG